MRFDELSAGDFFTHWDSVVAGSIWLKIRPHTVVEDEEFDVNAVDVTGECPGMLHGFEDDAICELVLHRVRDIENQYLIKISEIKHDKTK